jgi:putative membrane protein
MNEPMQNSYPPKVQDELARERNRVAADRSLLSFVRNSVTLISAGVSIDQIVRALSSNAPFIEAWVYTLSLTLIGLGVVNLGFAILDYHGEMKRLRQPEYYFTPRWSLGGVTGWILFVIGSLAFLRLLIVSLF